VELAEVQAELDNFTKHLVQADAEYFGLVLEEVAQE
jgi:hypothetical protein